MELTEKEWASIKDALEAQQQGLNPSGETMMVVAEILERHRQKGRAK